MRAGIREEAESILLENVEVEFRTCPMLGEGEEEAFEAAIRDRWMASLFSQPSADVAARIRRALAPIFRWFAWRPTRRNSGRLGIVAVDTLASGSIAADLMGRFLNGREGSVAITVVRYGDYRACGEILGV